MLHGARPDRIINQQVHEKTLGAHSRLYSKYPPAFDIDVHIDDAAGVAVEGRRHGFETIIINEDEENWTGYVKECLAGIEDQKRI
ncbi:hypothetical protein ACTHGU_05490 [Chitinophagaceae bacterium MMS25-I14]